MTPPDRSAEDARPLRMSVILATYNRSELAGQAIAAVLGDPATTEVVVTNDGSTDDTATVLASLARSDSRVKVLSFDHNQGRVAARNAALKHASGDVVVLLDDDVIAHPHLITGHQRHHQNADDLVVVGYMPVRLTADSSVTSVLYAQEYEGTAKAYRENSEVVLDRLWGGNVSLRRAHCVAVGLSGSQANASYHEDRDFGRRARDFGLRGQFDPLVRADHYHQRSLAGFLRDAQNRGQALAHAHDLDPSEPNPRPGLAFLGSPHVLTVAQFILGPMATSRRSPTPLAIGAIKALRRVATYNGAKRVKDRTSI